IEIPMTGVFATDDSGQIKRVGKMPSLGSFRFSQEMPNRTSPMQTLFGSSGAIGFQTSLTGSVDAVAMASDGSSIDVNLSFPGSRGFCGGYKSPLMLFFGEDRPSFKGISDFPIHPGKKTYWPEPGSAGYFLALDRDGNDRIDQRDELFGDQDKGGNNGFVELSKFDRNKDGIIDKKDAVYKRLRLWADADGDGISTPQEMKTLQEMRVESISLDYERNSVRPIGQTAEERQKSTFRFRTQDGVLQTGSIVDIWLKSP
nr:EF-hand domain-containing protein [Pseudobdellovibrionaceae bacterium]